MDKKNILHPFDTNNDKQIIIAGPCAIKSRDDLLEVGEFVAKHGADIIRTQLFKPRTTPLSFRGVGIKGLPWVVELKEKTGIPVAMEVMSSEEVDAVKDVVDILWVGARNMQNYDLLTKLSTVKNPVILKRGLIANEKEILGAVGYINNGNEENKVVLCERGIRSGGDITRFTLDLSGALKIMQDQNFPVIVDISHAPGHRNIVPALGRACIAAGFHGIVVEVDTDPDNAPVDTLQQLELPQFAQMMKEINKIRKALNFTT